MQLHGEFSKLLTVLLEYQLLCLKPCFFTQTSRIWELFGIFKYSPTSSLDYYGLGSQFVPVGRRHPVKIVRYHWIENFTSASQMVPKVTALSNLVCRILVQGTALPSCAIGLASLFLAGRAPGTKFLLVTSAENQPPRKTQVKFCSLLCMVRQTNNT